MANNSDNIHKVTHIPIFVEGRDEPIINTHPNSNTNCDVSSNASTETSTTMPSMGFNHRIPKNIAFANDIPKAGSIFDRAKSFPVKVFDRPESPRRSESPSFRQIPVYHQNPQHNETNRSSRKSSPAPQAPNNNEHAHKIQKDGSPDTLPKAPEIITQQKPALSQIESSIMKIQSIQKSVLEMMDRVEKFDGKSQKEYAFLDEMLTQDLLKLDTIDADGNENIKQSRRAAIKSINALISSLEMKRDAAKAAAANTETAIACITDEPQTESNESDSKTNTASKNSSYDNVSNADSSQCLDKPDSTDKNSGENPELVSSQN